MKTILLAAGAALVMIAPATAQEGADSASTTRVYACIDVADDLERLACYDAAVGRLKAAEETGDVVTVTREQVEEVKRDSFGFSLPSLPKLVMPKLGGDDDSEIKEMTIAVDRISRGGDGKFIVYLENGQVWQQIESKKVYYSAKRGVENVTIKSAALGSFRMQFDDGVPFRARRIQ
ncbi:MAG: hypothetical protein WA989_15430 [Henriciella sp.]|uniref:hypothetical protein n=1 Tax=Henriciella sp. TaxID=1968823 RepID=UPI003C756FA2